MCRLRVGQEEGVSQPASAVRLTDPLTLRCGLELPNRIVKAAMTEGLADADNNATPELERLYARWADSGLGMILTGNMMVDRRHLERARNVVVDAATDRARLRAYAQACAPVPTVVQLSHPGRQANRASNGSDASIRWQPIRLPQTMFTSLGQPQLINISPRSESTIPGERCYLAQSQTTSEIR